MATAEALGFVARPVAALAEADAGRWAGRAFAEVAGAEPEALRRWLSEPGAAPHGGESPAALAARVGAWLDDAPDGVVVCDAGVIRAALGHVLGLGPLATARFDVAPLSTTELTAGPARRVSHVNRKVGP